MQPKRAAPVVAFAALLAACATPAIPEPVAPAITIANTEACPISDADRAWLEASPLAWRALERDGLKLAPAARSPVFVMFDAACFYQSANAASWEARPHDGTIRTRVSPAAEITRPAEMAAFASITRDDVPYMMMALPSVWRTEPRAVARMGERLDRFMTSVFVHEMTHTRQLPAMRARMDGVRTLFRSGIGSETVQNRFAREAEFEASVKREIELLFEAADAPDAAAGRAKAKEALAMIEARRARWFTGENARFAGVEEYFLTLEGIAQLIQYGWMASPAGGWTQAEAMALTRNSSGVWALDQGFALMLVVDRFTPDWRGRAFGDNPAMATDMLRAAAGE
jgi:hypothetical protein